MSAEKTTKEKKTKKKTEKKIPEFDIKTPLELDKIGKFSKLKPNEQKFVVYLTTPGSPTENNVSQSLIRAGYARTTADRNGYAIRYRPDIDEVITEIQQKILMPRLNAAFNYAMSMYINALTADPAEEMEITEFYDSDGNKREIQTIKHLEDLSTEQRSYINGIKYEGGKGVPSFDKISKQEATKMLLAMKKETENALKDNNTDGYEVETTAEIIKGNLQVKTKVMKKNSEIAELSELKLNDSADREEED